jgi:hypothetical protein
MNPYAEMNTASYEDGRKYAEEIMQQIKAKIKQDNLVKDEDYMFDFSMGVQDGLASFVWDAEFDPKEV